jgi:hypothetical protein
MDIIANVEDLKRAKENEKALSTKKSEFVAFLKEIDQ